MLPFLKFTFTLYGIGIATWRQRKRWAMLTRKGFVCEWMCARRHPRWLSWSNGATRVSPANVGSCLELGTPFEMMMIMDSVLSLMESESSLGANKQAGTGNAKYPHLPLSTISSMDATMLLSFSSNPPIPLHRHKHTVGGYTLSFSHAHTQSSIFQSLAWSTVPSLPDKTSKSASLGALCWYSLGDAGLWGHGIKRIEIDPVSLVLLSSL